MKKQTLLLSFALVAHCVGYAQSQEPRAKTKVSMENPQFDLSSQKQVAEAHIPYYGAWQGRFEGDSKGKIKVIISEDGIAKVSCITDETGREFELSGPVEPSGAISATEKSFGPAGIKVHFKGQLTHRGTASGTWENSFFRLKGEWTATKINQGK